MSTADIDMVFGYLDKSRDNQITYSEFCNMCEEKRRDIDPFREYQDTQQKLQNKASAHLKQLLQIVLDKIKSSYENTAEAFRAFDQRNKG